MLEGWLGVMHKDVCGACVPGGFGTLPLAFGLSWFLPTYEQHQAKLSEHDVPKGMLNNFNAMIKQMARGSGAFCCL